MDDYEYVSMKVIVLLTADTSEIREKETVRESQEKVNLIENEKIPGPNCTIIKKFPGPS